MKKYWLSVFFLIVLFVSIFFVMLSKRDGTISPPSSKVAATIFPLYDITKNIAGDDIEVVLILSPGSSPHTYSSSPDQLKNLTGAKSVFKIGHGVDDWVDGVAEAVGVDNIVKVDSGIDLIGEDEHDDEETAVNPHYWLSVPNALQIAKQIKTDLVEQFPEYADQIAINYDAYALELEALDVELKLAFEILPTKNIATFHDAWVYFSEEYGVDVAAVFEEFPGKTPTPEYLKEFQEQISEHNVEVIYTEPQFSSEAIQSVVDDLGVEMSVLDPIGGVEGRDSYIEMMRFNMEQIIGK